MIAATHPPLHLLIATAAHGGDADWSPLDARLRPALERQALRLAGNPAAADDAVQIALLRIRRHLATFRADPAAPEPAAWAWALRIGANAARSQRSPACTIPLPDDLPQRAVPSDDERLPALRAALARLPAPLRHVVIAHHARGVPLATLARQLGVSAAVVRGRLRRGRAHLRAQLGAACGALLPLLGGAPTTGGGAALAAVGSAAAAAALIVCCCWPAATAPAPAPAEPSALPVAAIGAPVAPASAAPAMIAPVAVSAPAAVEPVAPVAMAPAPPPPPPPLTDRTPAPAPQVADDPVQVSTHAGRFLLVSAPPLPPTTVRARLHAEVRIDWREADLDTVADAVRAATGLNIVIDADARARAPRLTLRGTMTVDNVLTWTATLTSVRWAWAGYERSLAMLEKARDAGLQLRQTLQDLTHANVQLTRLNRLVDGLRQTAEDARRAKEQFVANVSHELRTPLNMIIGFAEMMLESPEAYGKRLPPTLLADLAVIHRNSQHLASLIDDVLDLSQIEAGQVALTKEWASLSAIVAEAVQSVSPLYLSKDLQLAADVPVDLPPVYCDRTRIREVLLNLLSNAGRFTEQGGVTLRAWQQGTQLIVTVTDTGPGIHEDQIGRLFQPFHQVDASTRRRHGGSGLGLSISKRLIELHGGEMTLESTLGVGTTVRFSLPITEPAPPSSSAARWLSAEWQYVERTSKSLAPRPSVRQRLVLLDTERSLERILQRYLQHVETVPVPTVQDAIRELAAVPSQALLINGPSLSQALRVLRSCPELPFGTPAIACAVPGSTEAAQALGATGYLLKPISKEALSATLKRLHITGKKILVVDDEPDARQLLRRMLAASGEGYLTLAAPDGETAFRLLRDERPDVVLLDLAMPGMDGFQFLAAKNQDAELQPIPVVVVSAPDPTGHPIITDAVAITRTGGLSAAQLLATIEASMRLLAPGRPPDPAWSGGQSD